MIDSKKAGRWSILESRTFCYILRFSQNRGSVGKGDEATSQKT
jgi:hypothetical protein